MALELENKILIKGWLRSRVQVVSRKLNPEHVDQRILEVSPLMDFIRSRQDSKEIIDEEPSVIAGVLRAALLIGSQKGDLLEYNYEMIRELLFEAVADRITRSYLV